MFSLYVGLGAHLPFLLKDQTTVDFYFLQNFNKKILILKMKER